VPPYIALSIFRRPDKGKRPDRHHPGFGRAAGLSEAQLDYLLL
jgi:hypothetical protein